MKLLIMALISLFLVQSPIILAGENNPHLTFSRKISFGKCPYGSTTDNVIYSIVTTFTNTSDENIYLVDGYLEPEYDSKYYALGFIFNFTSVLKTEKQTFGTSF